MSPAVSRQRTLFIFNYLLLGNHENDGTPKLFALGCLVSQILHFPSDFSDSDDYNDQGNLN